ncbi:acetyltransferase [Priestia aryabhattai]|uniref:GNAT family N-acetyltransferase n=1 Tax=Priestia aryabhattai TaxID=412384 RepID=UPI0030CF128F
MREQLKIASENDYIRIQKFLQKAGISTAGVEEHIHQFVIMESDEGELLATVGFEKEGMDGILRSLVVSPSLMQSDILLLFKSIVQLAQKHGVKQLYLLTNKASSLHFFQMMNFQQTSYSALPDLLKEHSYLKQLPNPKDVYVMFYAAS